MGLFSAVNSITSPHGGATIHYHYNPSGQLTQIQASNGYTVNLSYAQYHVTIIDSDHRTWVIQETTSNTYPVPNESLPYVNKIILPDGQSWQFFWTIVQNEHNENTGWGKIITPSGLTYSATRQIVDSDHLAFPITTLIYSGPGIPNSTWHYQYNAGSDPATTQVINNYDKRITYTFRNRYQKNKPLWNTGLILSKKIYNGQGSALFQTTTYQWGNREISAQQGGNAPELQKKALIRGTSSYTTEYDNYDVYGYPQRIVNSSAQGELSEGITYYENPTLWIFTPQNITTYNDGNQKVVDRVTRQFNRKGQLTQKTVNRVSTKYTYDTGGNLASLTDPMGHQTTYSHYLCGVAQTATDPLGNTQHDQMNIDGTLAAYTDPLGHITKLTYDTMLRPTSITYPEGNQITYQWDQAAQNSETLNKGKYYKQTILKNAYGKPSIITTIANGQTISQTFYYDRLDREIFHNYKSSLYGIQTAYDPLNRPISIQYGVKLHQSGGPTDNYTYNDSAETVAIHNPDGAVTTDQYRAFANPDKALLIRVTQANGVQTQINRNIIGQITSIQQGTQAYHDTYGPHHDLIQQTLPEIGTIVYTRDLDGRVTKESSNQTNNIFYAYDADGRLIGEQFSDLTSPTTYRYDADGHLIAALNTFAKWYYDYTNNSQLKTAKVVLPGANKTDTFSYQYNSRAQLNGLIYPDGLSIDYLTNPFGQPAELASPTITYLSHIHFGLNQALASFQSPNGNTTNDVYNTRNLISNITVDHGSAPLLSRHYTYDPATNITAITAQSSSNNQSMQYNAINELTQASGPWGKTTYQYDQNNNITQRTLKGQVYNYHYNTQNRLSSLTGTLNDTFAYDLNGNITQLGQLKLFYNVLNQLISVAGKNSQGKTVLIHYLYDANGNRVAIVRGNQETFTLYNRHHQLLFKQGATNSSDTADYLYLESKLVVKTTDAGKGPSTWFHNNLLGSPIAASTQTAMGLNWQQQYQPYGTEIKDLTAQQPISHTSFTGKQQDSSTHLAYYS